MAASLSLRIDFDAAGAVRLTVTAAAPVGGGNTANVSFPLNFDPEHPTPLAKRREGESDAAYGSRLATVLPHGIDLPPEFLAGLPERCAEIVEAARPVADHYAARAAAEHSLLAAGKAPPGVKTLKVGGTLGATGKATV